MSEETALTIASKWREMLDTAYGAYATAGERNRARDCARELENRLSSIRADSPERLKRLLAYLVRYGHHDPSCDLINECRCGFDNACQCALELVESKP